MFPSSLTPRTTRALVAVAWSIALAWSAWVAADLLNRALAPPVSAASRDFVAEPHAAAQRIIARSSIATAGAGPHAPGGATEPRHRFTVVGLATGFGTAPGFALLRGDDGRVVTARAGEMLPSGARVVAIDARHVELEHEGRRERITLAPMAAATPPPSAPILVNPPIQR